MQNFSHTTDIICAISSPPGVGAISLIRLSGAGSIELFNLIFSKDISNAKGYTVHFGNIIKNEELLDEVVVTIFKNPQSFTGEDIVEIACHGSIYIQQELLSLLIDLGARMAAAGEFSKRAFFNGKMDLSQTESIADLIHSESEGAHRLAIQQMKGGISNQLSELRQKMMNFASLIELELDFSEEDVEFADRTALIALIEEVQEVVAQLTQSFKLGNAIKNGVTTAIVGRPNAGKSTLLNALLKEDRAIVSEIAGTTRDTIEEVLTIEGIDFRFIDTAGLRETEDTIEKIGVARALAQVEKSAVYIYLFDMDAITVSELETDLENLPIDIPRLVVANKSDIVAEAIQLEFENTDIEMIFISAKENESLLLLQERLLKLIDVEDLSAQKIIVTNVRHYEALRQANADLLKVKEGLESGISGDFLAMDIRQAMHHLGTITGEVTTDDLLGNIFANFCIGK